MKIIDAHIHLNLAETAPVSSLLRQLDNNGVEKAVLILNQKDEFDAFVKDITSFNVDRNRFWIASGINIHEEESFIRFERLRQLGISPIVKIHPRLFKIQKGDIPGVVASIAPYDTQIIVDSLFYGSEIEYHNGIETGLAIALRYPERKVIMAHSGSIDFLRCMMATRYLPNVFYDYSFIQSFFPHTSLRLDMVDFLGRTANRIMFGSDYPSFNIEKCVQDFSSLCDEAGLNDELRSKLFKLNAIAVYSK